MTTITQFDTLPQCAKTRRGLVAVAMSGGVDSSAVAALLQQQGCTVVGLTMQLWNQRRLPELQGAGPARHRCCSLDDVYDAKAVAQHLNFPHYVVNFEEHFEDRVVRPFVDQYLTGRTPIACTNCNTDVKFEPLLRMARQIGAERLATGHYARIRKNAGSGRSELLRARDETKDQSYFLWGLSEEQLSRSDFPLGELTKEEVRALARRANLPVAEKPESMELCFVPNGNYVQFIQAYSQERGISLQNGEGEIVTDSAFGACSHRQRLTGPWIEIVAQPLERGLVHRPGEPEPGGAFAAPQADQFLSFAVIVRHRVVAFGVPGTILLRDSDHA